MVNKVWGARIFAGLTLYFVMLVLIITYGEATAEAIGVEFGANVTEDVSLNETFGVQYTCGYPRYRYNAEGQAARYFFDLDNSDCEISLGAISEGVCNNIAGCTWSNVTTGWLWFRETTAQCTGDINKSAYNNGATSTENICNIDGLQGDANVGTCSVLGCSVYAPRQDVSGGVSNPLTMLDTVGDLFLFRVDFGIENALWAFIATFAIFYIPFLALLFSIYILSPFSN